MAVSEGRCAVTWHNELRKTGRWIIKTYRALNKKYLTPSTFNHLTGVHIRPLNTERGIFRIPYLVFVVWPRYVSEWITHIDVCATKVWSSPYTVNAKLFLHKWFYTERYSNVFLVQQKIGSPLPYLSSIHVWPTNPQFKTSVITDDFNLIFNFRIKKF